MPSRPDSQSQQVQTTRPQQCTDIHRVTGTEKTTVQRPELARNSRLKRLRSGSGTILSPTSSKSGCSSYSRKSRRYTSVHASQLNNPPVAFDDGISSDSNPAQVSVLDSGLVSRKEDAVLLDAHTGTSQDNTGGLVDIREENSLASAVFCGSNLLSGTPLSENPLSPSRCFKDQDPDSNACLLDLKSVDVTEVCCEVDDDQDAIAATPATTTNDDAAISETEDEGIKVTYNDVEADAESTVGSSFGGCIIDRSQHLQSCVNDLGIQRSPHSFCSSSSATQTTTTIHTDPLSMYSLGDRSPSVNQRLPDNLSKIQVCDSRSNHAVYIQSRNVPQLLDTPTISPPNDDSHAFRSQSFPTVSLGDSEPRIHKPSLSSFSSTASLTSTGSLGLGSEPSVPGGSSYSANIEICQHASCDAEPCDDPQHLSSASSPTNLIASSKLAVLNRLSDATALASSLPSSSSGLFFQAREMFSSTVPCTNFFNENTSTGTKCPETTRSGISEEVSSHAIVRLADSGPPTVKPSKTDRSNKRTKTRSKQLAVKKPLTADQRSKSPSPEPHIYPLRSRIRQESLRKQWQAAQTAPRTFDRLPTEILLRIVQYLSVQDLFRTQRVNKRLRAVIDKYLLLVKRLNFSNGLPFAFLPEKLDDAALKRILSRTPEVTHILGFYPRRFQDSFPMDTRHVGPRFPTGEGLSYSGIIEAFRSCSKLRSVELMDVELMGRLVHCLQRVKFHGMFRNRPDSWDCEYAVPMPSEPMQDDDVEPTATNLSPHLRLACNRSESEGRRLQHRLIESPYLSCLNVLFNTLAPAHGTSHVHDAVAVQDRTSSPVGANFALFDILSSTASRSATNEAGLANSAALAHAAAAFAHRAALKSVKLADWFEPVSESPLGQGSPSASYPNVVPTQHHGAVRALNVGIGVPTVAANTVHPIPPHPQQQHAAVIANHQNAADFAAIQRPPFFPPLVPMDAEFMALYPQVGIGPQQQMGIPIEVTGTVRRQTFPLGDVGPMVALAIAAAFGPPQPPAVDGRWRVAANNANLDIGVPAPAGLVPIRARIVDNLPFGAPRARARGVSPSLPAAPTQHENNDTQAPEARPQEGQRSVSSSHIPPNASRNVLGPGLASPLPAINYWIGLPNVIANLTKLDLVSVSISNLPRLDNIKYLHLKWVVFASADPFSSFSAIKLQSFVMNNCIGPARSRRYGSIFAALARAPQLMRMELVATRFVDGLIEAIIDADLASAHPFRNLQRLVLAGNKDATEMDVGLLLVAGQTSLNHVALQIWHTRNSLFEALAFAGVRLMRLESLVLGYQDPYQSRLTTSELASVELVDSSDSLMPVCSITDRGIATMFKICPRLSGLTVRHAPYITSFAKWVGSPAVAANTENNTGQPEQTAAPEAPSAAAAAAAASAPPPREDGDAQQTSSSAPLPLRSLTLENCPCISVQDLENTLATGSTFSSLDCLVLRHMFPQRRVPTPNLTSTPPLSWHERWGRSGTTDATTTTADSNSATTGTVNWRKLGLLLSISDHLSARRCAFASLAPTGVGLGASVREVNHVNPPAGIRPADLPVKPFDTFFTLRTHTYLTSLLQADGSCGPGAVGRSRIIDLLFDGDSAPCNSKTTLNNCPESAAATAAAGELDSEECEFVSRSTQTCVCGYLEWDFVLRMQDRSVGRQVPKSSAPGSAGHSKGVQTATAAGRQATGSRTSSSTGGGNGSFPTHPSRAGAGATGAATAAVGGPAPPHSYLNTLQLGGPLAFHPFAPSPQHMALYQFITASEWSRQILASRAFASICDKRLLQCITGADECKGCASDAPLFGLVSPSLPQVERALKHTPRTWVARDACLNTSELRCFTGPQPTVLTIAQPLGASFSCLTTLHFEKVGISHLVLTSAPRLKNITLENCPVLTSIIIHPVEAMSAATIDPLPALRRVRVIRCPKFAIYHWLYTAAKMFPNHDDNLFITYRPFGRYNSNVESALWDNAQNAHVMISHDYKQQESERIMEEFHSSFDQLFREVMNFSDMLIRRELVSGLQCSPSAKGGNNVRPLTHSEHGPGWKLVTDIPWVHKVCCSMLPNTDTSLSNQADQLYELLSEVQSRYSNYKLCRRGIHLHVQYRDVHGDPLDGSPGARTDTADASDWTSFVDHIEHYLNWPYTESYLNRVHPADDLNVWGDGCNEALAGVLPPHLPLRHANRLRRQHYLDHHHHPHEPLRSDGHRSFYASLLLVDEQEKIVVEDGGANEETEERETVDEHNCVMTPNAKKRRRSSASDYCAAVGSSKAKQTRNALVSDVELAVAEEEKAKGILVSDLRNRKRPAPLPSLCPWAGAKRSRLQSPTSYPTNGPNLRSTVSAALPLVTREGQKSPESVVGTGTADSSSNGSHLRSSVS
uniref:F-box domain-containing protein n=1 Tax=Schistocephalus solidus TaxID=70667 RepID=A0A0X3NLH8_SCHSO